MKLLRLPILFSYYMSHFCVWIKEFLWTNSALYFIGTSGKKTKKFQETTKSDLAFFLTLVPLFLSQPKLANHSPPRLQMSGATATVSRLDTVVGQPNTPTSAGKGGFSLGLPAFPSINSIKAWEHTCGRYFTYGKLIGFYKFFIYLCLNH